MLDRKLEKAVDLKIGEQKKFVAWWDGNVTGQGTRTDLSRDHGESPGRGGRKSNRVPGSIIPKDDAEALTGMQQQRVSDLGGMTKEEPRARREVSIFRATQPGAKKMKLTELQNRAKPETRAVLWACDDVDRTGRMSGSCEMRI
jgi:hypothetical protein